LQLAEVGTNRCVDINYGISDVNAYLFCLREFSAKSQQQLIGWLEGQVSKLTKCFWGMHTISHWTVVTVLPNSIQLWSQYSISYF